MFKPAEEHPFLAKAPICAELCLLPGSLKRQYDYEENATLISHNDTLPTFPPGPESIITHPTQLISSYWGTEHSFPSPITTLHYSLASVQKHEMCGLIVTGEQGRKTFWYVPRWLKNSALYPFILCVTCPAETWTGCGTCSAAHLWARGYGQNTSLLTPPAIPLCVNKSIPWTLWLHESWFWKRNRELHSISHNNLYM